MRARFIKQVGVRGQLRIYWDGTRATSVEPCDQCPGGHVKTEYADSCPNSYGKGRPGIHNALVPLGDKLGTEDFKAFGEVADYPEERWPTVCSDCGAPVPKAEAEPKAVGEAGVMLRRQVFVSRLYDSPSGQPEAGDVYQLRWHDPGECPYWDNCDGTHTYGILPNGHTWDMDSRASNCDKKADRTHRCWVKQGSAEAGSLDVGKGGNTCGAGAGSILVDGWHGFLRGFTWQG